MSTNTHRTGPREQAWPYRRTTATGATFRLSRTGTGKWALERNDVRLIVVTSQSIAILITDYCILNDSVLSTIVSTSDVMALLAFMDEANGAATRTAQRHDPSPTGDPTEEQAPTTRRARARTRAAEPAPSVGALTPEDPMLTAARKLEAKAARLVDLLRQGQAVDATHLASIEQTVSQIVNLAAVTSHA